MNRSDVVLGRETANTTLIIDGLIENDGTTVQCVAAGFVNGTFQYNSSDTHTLRISGINCS